MGRYDILLSKRASCVGASLFNLMLGIINCCRYNYLYNKLWIEGHPFIEGRGREMSDDYDEGVGRSLILGIVFAAISAPCFLGSIFGAVLKKRRPLVVFGIIAGFSTVGTCSCMIYWMQPESDISMPLVGLDITYFVFDLGHLVSIPYAHEEISNILGDVDDDSDTESNSTAWDSEKQQQLQEEQKEEQQQSNSRGNSPPGEKP